MLRLPITECVLIFFFEHSMLNGDQSSFTKAAKKMNSFKNFNTLRDELATDVVRIYLIIFNIVLLILFFRDCLWYVVCQPQKIKCFLVTFMANDPMLDTIIFLRRCFASSNLFKCDLSLFLRQGDSCLYSAILFSSSCKSMISIWSLNDVCSCVFFDCFFCSQNVCSPWEAKLYNSMSFFFFLMLLIVVDAFMEVIGQGNKSFPG